MLIMSNPFDTIYAEENKHCLVCHHENAIVIHHPARNLDAKEYGLIEVVCKNENCKAKLTIPILEKPYWASRKKFEGKVEGWW